MRTTIAIATLAIGTVAAALGLAACSSSSPSTPSAGGQSTTSTSSTGTPSTKGCPSAAVMSTAMGLTFTGPVTGTAGGTAPCVYSGPGGLEVNVLFNAPGLSESDFTSQTQSGLGPTNQAVAGIGKEAYLSTAYGHVEIDVWVSASESFSVVIDTSDATVQPDNTPQAEAVATAIVAG